MPDSQNRGAQNPRAASRHCDASGQPLRSLEGRSSLLLCLGLGVLVFVTFLPALHNGFVNFDDPLYVTDNIHVQKGLSCDGLKWAFSATAASNWHPLTWFSYMADFDLYGLKPWGYHLTNILLHVLNACLAFLVLCRLTGSTWRSFAVAVLFSLHPLRVESVAWVAERKDVLSAFFFFLTVWAYTRYAEARVKCQVPSVRSQVPSPKSQVSSPKHSDHVSRFTFHVSPFYLLALALFALGLTSKPMLVTLPFVLLLLDYWPLGRWRIGARGDARPPGGGQSLSGLRGLIWEKSPFFVLAAASCVVTLLVQNRAGAVAQTLPLGARLGNMPVAYCRYLAKVFWPAGLCVMYPHPDYWPWSRVAGSVVVLVLVSILGLLTARRRPYLLVGWLWFLGMLVPVVGLVQVGQQSMADRYTYLPTIGLFIAFLWGTYGLGGGLRIPHFIWLGAWVAGGLACVLVTQQQIAFWKNSETLFRRALAVTGDNSLAHGALARALADEGRADEAIVEFREAIKLNPQDTIARNGLGDLLLRNSDLDGALREFQAALKQNANDPFSLNNVGMVLARTGRMDDALSYFQQAVRLEPASAEFQANLALALSAKGRLEEAIGGFESALKLDPGVAKTHKNLGVALARVGRLDEAVTEFQTALRLQPDYIEAKKYLELALKQKAGALGPGP